MKVLLVEDEPKIADFVVTDLAARGMAVTRCADGHAGHALARREAFDAILLDILLPGRDGLPVLKGLRAVSVATPVIWSPRATSWAAASKGPTWVPTTAWPSPFLSKSWPRASRRCAAGWPVTGRTRGKWAGSTTGCARRRGASPLSRCAPMTWCGLRPMWRSSGGWARPGNCCCASIRPPVARAGRRPGLMTALARRPANQQPTAPDPTDRHATDRRLTEHCPMACGPVVPGRKGRRRAARFALANVHTNDHPNDLTNDPTNSHSVVAAGLASTKAELQGAVQQALTVIVPLALLPSALGAWLLASLTMRPMNLLRSAMTAVTQQALDQQLPSAGEDLEFKAVIGDYHTMLARLEASFHQAARFSADAAHELKTPLTLLQGRIEQATRQSQINPSQIGQSSPLPCWPA